MAGVVICDDHRVFGEALSAVLQANGYEVLACTTEPETGIAAVARHQPSLYVVDVYFPGGNGLAGLGAVSAASPATRTVVLSGSCDPEIAADAKRAGAEGFVAKDRPIEEILAALRDVLDGTPVFHGSMREARPNAANGRLDQSELDRLTAREREVLERLVEGEDTTSLAKAMGVTYSTARTHIQSLLTKLGVHSKLEAVALFTSASRRHAESDQSAGGDGARRPASGLVGGGDLAVGDWQQDGPTRAATTPLR